MIENMIDFLKARISEDADAAYDAAQGSGDWYVGTNPDYHFEEGIWDNADPVNQIVCMREYPEDGYDWPRGRHIVRHSPNRAFSDATAKLVLITQYQQASKDGLDDYAARIFAVLRFFAASYGDHPDYLSEYRM